MLSLILTVLLGLFCYSGSFFNRLDDHKENILYLDDSSSIKNAYSDNGFTYVSWSDFTNPSWIKNTIYNMLAFEGTYLSTGKDANDFLNGQLIDFNLNNTANFSDMVKFANYDINTDSMNIASSIRMDFISFQFINEHDTYKRFYVNFGFTYNGVQQTYSASNIEYVAKNTWSGVLYSTSNNVIDESLNNKYLCGVALNFPWLHNSSWDTLGYNDYYNQGYNVGYNDGTGYGFQDGYRIGYSEGSNTDATASTIFTGILDVALIPVNVFLTIFNFEVFGINISGIVSGLLTISVVIIIFRFLFGGSKDD